MYRKRLIRKGFDGLDFQSILGTPNTSLKLTELVKPSTNNPNVSISGSKFQLGDAAMGIGSAAAGLLNSLGSGHLTDSQSAIRGIGYGALSVVNPFIGMAAQAFDGALGALGLGLDTIDSTAADRFNINQTGTQILNSIPVIGSVAGLFGGDTNQAYKSTETTELASSYGNSLGDIDAAVNLSGKRMLFGRGKANDAIAEANRQNRLITQIGREANKYKNNSFGDIQRIANQNIYSGYTPGLALAKKGTKLPKLEEARNTLYKFQNGGVISKNVIPDGALHKNKHHLEDINPDLDGEITSKGIPVIAYDDNGEIQQCAEIEKNELTLTLDTTKKLEEYFNNYNSSKDDSIAIECGKFLVEQILKNTIDNTGLIKEVQ